MTASTLSWEAIYENYSRKGLVDPNAPVHATGEIEIAASTSAVWSVLTDVGRWPNIRSDISDIEPAPAADGESFAWSTAGIRLLSRFGRVVRPYEVCWATAAAGLATTHVYTLQALGTGRTLLACEEAMTAPAAPQIGSDELAERIKTWLAGIKILSEAQPDLKGGS